MLSFPRAMAFITPTQPPHTLEQHALTITFRTIFAPLYNHSILNNNLFMLIFPGEHRRDGSLNIGILV